MALSTARSRGLTTDQMQLPAIEHLPLDLLNYVPSAQIRFPAPWIYSKVWGNGYHLNIRFIPLTRSPTRLRRSSKLTTRGNSHLFFSSFMINTSRSPAKIASKEGRGGIPKLVSAGETTVVFGDNTLKDDVTKTIPAAILEQHDLGSVWRL